MRSPWGAAGKGGQEAQALGRSRGGFSSKIHVMVDALGNPLRFYLTAGQRHEVTQAEALLAGYEPERVIADKAYDSEVVLDKVAEMNAEAVIPPRTDRKEVRTYDEDVY